MEIKGPLTATWKADPYGYPERTLYLGKLHVGHIYCNTNRVWLGLIIGHHPEPELVDRFATADEARRSVEEAVAKALADG